MLAVYQKYNSEKCIVDIIYRETEFLDAVKKAVDCEYNMVDNLTIEDILDSNCFKNGFYLLNRTSEIELVEKYNHVKKGWVFETQYVKVKRVAIWKLVPINKNFDVETDYEEIESCDDTKTYTMFDIENLKKCSVNIVRNKGDDTLEDLIDDILGLELVTRENVFVLSDWKRYLKRYEEIQESNVYAWQNMINYSPVPRLFVFDKHPEMFKNLFKDLIENCEKYNCIVIVNGYYDAMFDYLYVGRESDDDVIRQLSKQHNLSYDDMHDLFVSIGGDMVVDSITNTVYYN